MFDSANLYRPGVLGGGNREIYAAYSHKVEDNEAFDVREGMVAFDSLGNEFIVAVIVKYQPSPDDAVGDGGKRFVIVCSCLRSYP